MQLEIISLGVELWIRCQVTVARLGIGVTDCVFCVVGVGVNDNVLGSCGCGHALFISLLGMGSLTLCGVVVDEVNDNILCGCLWGQRQSVSLLGMGSLALCGVVEDEVFGWSSAASAIWRSAVMEGIIDVEAKPGIEFPIHRIFESL